MKMQHLKPTDKPPTKSREFLSREEIARLLAAARQGRHGVRDHLLFMMMYRHGLRVSEATKVKLPDVDLYRSKIWVRRLKNGQAVEQPIPGDEYRAIKCYLKQRVDRLPWLFISERGQPLTRQAVNYLMRAAGARAQLPNLHPHMLRHSCGFYLADQDRDLRLIQDYLGHRDPKHTLHYTRVHDSRFKGLWSPTKL